MGDNKIELFGPLLSVANSLTIGVFDFNWKWRDFLRAADVVLLLLCTKVKKRFDDWNWLKQVQNLLKVGLDKAICFGAR